jgi:mannosyltransferase OCH1-like enzyme
MFTPAFKQPIPKIIHQTAPSDETKWNPIWKPCQESWKRNFPNWEYRLWNDEDLDIFIKTKYSWFYPTFSGYSKNINRIDAARYFILYEYGGIYSDMDFECLKNFEHLLLDGCVNIAESPHYPGEKYQNALMVSTKHHPFWKSIWKYLDKHKTHENVLVSTGPHAIISHEGMFHPLPREKFAPWIIPVGHRKDVDPLKSLEIKSGPDVYTRHHGTCTWC